MNDAALPAPIEELAMMLDLGTGPRLEARLARGEGHHLALLCHPHPLFGGSMDDPIVLLLRGTFAELGIGTLRFNVRGVGGSEGSWDGGHGEAADLRAIADLVQRRAIHTGPPLLAGYSFGAWLVAKACSQGLEPKGIVLVSPPVDFLSFANFELPAARSLIAVGQADELASTAGLRRWLRSQPDTHPAPVLRVVPEADHFWSVGQLELRDAVRSFLATIA